jgi:hypothetical protein
MLRSFRAAVEDWDEVCSALGAWERRNLLHNPSEDVRAEHKASLTELISWGEMVREATGHTDFPDPQLAERVRQRLIHLRDKMALWHDLMDEAEEDRILNAAFQ